MEHIVDPIADWIFDAAVIDVSEKGTVETKPLTDEDWLKVERGALILAESANLLKMPRTMVPAGDKSLNAEQEVLNSRRRRSRPRSNRSSGVE